MSTKSNFELMREKFASDGKKKRPLESNDTSLGAQKKKYVPPARGAGSGNLVTSTSNSGARETIQKPASKAILITQSSSPTASGNIKSETNDADAGKVSFGSISALEHVAKEHGVKLEPSGKQSNQKKTAPSTSLTTSVLKSSVLGPFENLSLTPEERRYVAVDCEMVGVGSDGRRSALAQVVCVNWAGVVLYCTYVKVKEHVTDFRTFVSGILPHHISSAPSLEEVQSQVSNLLQNKILVGHSLKNDLRALLLKHPHSMIRDTATYKPFCWKSHGGKLKPKKLSLLCKEHLKIDIQDGTHDPAEDARAALALYKLVRRDWEISLVSRAS
jgi:DNA polymerase III epsilon subunit-like protein